jgi:hypothetical protein
VQIQIVLYQHHPAEIERLLTSLLASIRLARHRKRVERAVIRLGDCSERPILDAHAVEGMSSPAARNDVELSVEVFGENLGHGRGQNRLARDAVTETLLFVNPDGVAAPLMISHLIDALDSDVVAAEARQSPFEHPKAYDTRTGTTAWVTGAATLVRTKSFVDVGGFDERFFLHCDDVDLSWRLRLAGGRLVYVPEAVFNHDKRLDDTGMVGAPPTERVYTTLGVLLLLHKYSRPETLNHWKAHIESKRDQAELLGLERFRDLRNSGGLPEAIDPDHQVSEVIGAHFGPHRY